jgi:multidrug efflux system membrane fusion protein
LDERNFEAPRALAGRAKPAPWRTLIGAAVVILIAIGLAQLLTFCARSPAATADRQPGGPGGGAHRKGGAASGGLPPITVSVATASPGPVPIQISALGTVTPLATINVNARVSGMLDNVAFREGQMVRKGQLLALIDPRPFQVAEQQAQGQLDHDQALLETARLDLARYQTLRAQDSVSGQTYDTQAALVRQDEATVAADRAAVANAKLNLSFTRIASPVAGRVGLRQIDPGNQITANETTPVAVVTQITPMTVVFSVPEGDIGQVVKHEAAQHGGGAGLLVTAFDRAGGTMLARGTLATLDNQIDTTTGTVKAKAMFRNADGALFPNQFVNVALLVDTLRDQIIVPTTATRHGPQGDFVWVLQRDRTVKARPVTVGPGTAETVSIVSGLKAGEVVVTDGGDRLREGSKVVLPQARPAGGGSATSAGGGEHRRRQGGAPNSPAPAGAPAPE